MNILHILIAIISIVLATSKAAGQVVVVGQRYNGNSAPEWVLCGAGHTPVLAASQSIDANGSSWLRLTSNGGNQVTYAYNSKAFDGTNAAIAVRFDYAGNNGTGADGVPETIHSIIKQTEAVLRPCASECDARDWPFFGR